MEQRTFILTSSAAKETETVELRNKDDDKGMCHYFIN